MPLVKIVADCGLQTNNQTEANFPLLEEAALLSFSGCNFSVVNLPSLQRFKNEFFGGNTFLDCKNL